MDNQLQYHMKLRVYYEERNFGPGVAGLMVLIREKGSLSAACKELGMAYSKAWKILKKAEEDLGILLVEKTRGGVSGGQTLLTPEGEEFLEKYLAFETEARKEVNRLFHQYFSSNS